MHYVKPYIISVGSSRTYATVYGAAMLGSQRIIYGAECVGSHSRPTLGHRYSVFVNGTRRSNGLRA